MGSQSLTSSRWLKVGSAFIVGALLGCLSIALTSMSTSTISTTSATESTELVSLATSRLASPEILNGLGNSPFKTPAILAIEAVNSDRRVRDVKIKAVRSAMEYLEPEEREKLETMGAKVQELAKKMPGITKPMDYFDPVGFSTKCSLGTLLFWREAELKHGRLGMIATLGILMGEKFGPILGAKSVPAAIALKDTPMGSFWWAVLLVVSFPEIAKPASSYSYEKVAGGSWWVADAEKTTVPADLIPGDYGWDPLGLKPKSAAEFLELQNKELNNGRLAMLAAAGIIAQEALFGKKVF